MARFAIIAPPLRGHLDPLGALARALEGAGHQVVFLMAEGEPAPAGCRVRELALAVAGELGRRVSGASGLFGTLATIRAMARRTAALCEALPNALVAERIDVVLADQTEAAGALAALRAGLPWVTIGCGLPLNREEGIPPPYVGWMAAEDARTLAFNRGAARVIDAMMRPLSSTIALQARRWGLQGMARLDDTFSPALQLFQMPAALDFPRREWPAHAQRLGPFREPEAGAWAPPDEDGRPLAFCSLGTLQGGRFALFARFAEALAGQGYRPVIVHCGRLDARQVAALPGRPVVADFLPQRAVLARSALALVHGGMNTTLDALAAGVPMLVVPIAFEQAGIAARVAASGAGLALKPRELGRQLPQAIRRLASDPSFGVQARRLALASAGGTERAVALLSAFASRHSLAS